MKFKKISSLLLAVGILASMVVPVSASGTASDLLCVSGNLLDSAARARYSEAIYDEVCEKYTAQVFKGDGETADTSATDTSAIVDGVISTAAIFTNAGANSIIVLDLGKEKEIDRVDLWAVDHTYNTSVRKTRSITVWTSIDNSDWQEQGTYDLEGERTGASTIDQLTVSFAATNARYVKIQAILDEGANQHRITEVCVFNTYEAPAVNTKAINIGGNVLNDAALAKYTALGQSVTNAAGQTVYTPTIYYGDETTVDSADQTELTNGAITSAGTHTKNNENSVFVLDLGSAKTFDRVDMWAVDQLGTGTVRKTGAIDVYISTDNTNWYRVGGDINDTEIRSDATVDLLSASFNPVKAQYIKIKTTLYTGAAQNRIAEIVVLETIPNVEISPVSNNITCVSGNALTEATKTTYKEYGYNIDELSGQTAFTYKGYLSDGVSDGGDSATDELNNGVISPLAGGGAYLGKYNGDDVIVMDLGSEKTIDRVDIWAHDQKTSAGVIRKVGSVKVEYSADNAIWKDFGTVTNTNELVGNTDAITELLTVQYVPVSVRYLRLTFTRYSGAHQNIFSEIVAISSRGGATGLGFADSEGVAIEEAYIDKDSYLDNYTGNIFAVGEICGDDGIIVAAQYSEGEEELKNVWVSTSKIGSKKLDLGAHTALTSGDVLKVFAFDSIGTLKSLNTPVSVSILGE